MAEVVVLAEWNWHGHHPTYFCEFIKSLLRSGTSVLALCPEPDSIAEQPFFKEPLNGGRLRLGVIHARKRRVRPRRLREFVRMFELFSSLRTQIRTLERSIQKDISLVFFCCMYESEFRLFPFFGGFLSRPLAGLSLYSNMFRNPGGPSSSRLLQVLRRNAFKCVAVLDEGTSDAYERAIGKKVVVFPEITNLAEPSRHTPLVRRMLRLADGRPIVGALGYLHSYKGVATLAKVALEGETTALYAFIGEIPWSAYSHSDRRILEDALNHCENVFFHPVRVDDGLEFNSAVASCDIIYAAYHDFPNSSNMLTKAALARKPVIVSDGYVMAERVRKYMLGMVVPQQDSSAVQRAISTLLNNETNQPALWHKYLSENSESALDAAFGQILHEAGAN